MITTNTLHFHAVLPLICFTQTWATCTAVTPPLDPSPFLCDHDSRFYSTLLCVSRVLVFMRPDWRTTVSAAWSGRTRVITAKTSASEIRAVIWIPASPNAVVYIQIPGPRGGSYERLLSESSSSIPDKNPEQWHQTGHGYISAENVNRSVIVTRSAFFLPFYTDKISQKYDRDQIINIFQQLYKNDDQINFKGDVYFKKSVYII